MRGESIICFAKDWDEDPTCNNHIMVELAKGNRVLWLNSVATRAPKLGSKRDIGKIFKKLASFLRSAKEKKPNLWVYTPIVIPLPHSKWAAAANRWILRLTIGYMRRKLGMDQFQLWTFLPNVGPFIGTLGESVSVYYCTDEWSKFTYVNGPRIAAAERELLEKVDIVFATAQSLVNNRIGTNPETHLARHGVDHAKFARVLDPTTPVPDDLASISQPVIGFYGTIQDWIDFDLIEYLAERHPEWSIVLLGTILVDTTRLKRFPNVHLLGRKSHSMLAEYCKGFSVGLIPYILNERILHVNPVKLREYLSAGLPVVSAALPEVKQLSQFCAAATKPDEFERKIAEALKQDTQEKRLARSQAMRVEDWQHKVAELLHASFASPIAQVFAAACAFCSDGSRLITP